MVDDEIDFESDSFADIVSRDSRYNARAYALLMDVIHFLSSQSPHMSAGDILEEFKERTIDQYGPMSFTVLREWGVTCCEDVGEMMFNLAEGNRVSREENDTADAFIGGYDFREVFLNPYCEE